MMLYKLILINKFNLKLNFKRNASGRDNAYTQFDMGGKGDDGDDDKRLPPEFWDKMKSHLIDNNYEDHNYENETINNSENIYYIKKNELTVENLNKILNTVKSNNDNINLNVNQIQNNVSQLDESNINNITELNSNIEDLETQIQNLNSIISENKELIQRELNSIRENSTFTIESHKSLIEQINTDISLRQSTIEQSMINLQNNLNTIHNNILERLDQIQLEANRSVFSFIRNFASNMLAELGLVKYVFYFIIIAILIFVLFKILSMMSNNKSNNKPLNINVSLSPTQNQPILEIPINQVINPNTNNNQMQASNQIDIRTAIRNIWLNLKFLIKLIKDDILNNLKKKKNE